MNDFLLSIADNVLRSSIAISYMYNFPSSKGIWSSVDEHRIGMCVENDFYLNMDVTTLFRTVMFSKEISPFSCGVCLFTYKLYCVFAYKLYCVFAYKLCCV